MKIMITTQSHTMFVTYSFKFVSSSLASLVETLPSLCHSRRLQTLYPTLVDDLILRKGVFPYRYIAVSKLYKRGILTLTSFEL